LKSDSVMLDKILRGIKKHCPVGQGLSLVL
jgi:hypothetical protein